MMSEQEEHQQPTFQYCIKVERTQKGARWTVHCYGKDLETSMTEAVKAYDEIGKKLADKALAIAPAESGSGGKSD